MRASKLTKFMISVVCTITMVAGNIVSVYANDGGKVKDNFHDKFNELYNTMVSAVQNHDVNTLRSIYEPGTSEEELSSMANQEVSIDGFEQYPTSYIGPYKSDGAVYMTGYYKVDNAFQSDYSYTYSYSAYYMKRVNGNFYLANSTNSRKVITKVFCKNLMKNVDYEDDDYDHTSEPYYYMQLDYEGKNVDESTDESTSKLWFGDHQPTYSSSTNDAKTDKHIDQDYLSYHYPYGGALHIEAVALWQIDRENAFMLLCFENGINSTNEEYKKDVYFQNIHVEFKTPEGKKIISQNINYDSKDSYVSPGSEDQKVYYMKLKNDVDSWDNLNFNVTFDYQFRQ